MMNYLSFTIIGDLMWQVTLDMIDKFDTLAQEDKIIFRLVTEISLGLRYVTWWF